MSKPFSGARPQPVEEARPELVEGWPLGDSLSAPGGRGPGRGGLTLVLSTLRAFLQSVIRDHADELLLKEYKPAVCIISKRIFRFRSPRSHEVSHPCQT